MSERKKYRVNDVRILGALSAYTELMVWLRYRRRLMIEKGTPERIDGDSEFVSLGCRSTCKEGHIIDPFYVQAAIALALWAGRVRTERTPEVVDYGPHLTPPVLDGSTEKTSYRRIRLTKEGAYSFSAEEEMVWIRRTLREVGIDPDEHEEVMEIIRRYWEAAGDGPLAGTGQAGGSIGEGK